jgi:4-hydroxy-tetrahydrodipicolinate synthase
MACAEYVVKKALRRVPVFVQAGGMSAIETLKLANHSISIGADGIAVITPSYFRLSQEAIRDYYISVACSLPQDFPIYLYSIPEYTGNDILPETASDIAEKCPNIIGIKYSGDDMVRLLEFTLIRDGSFSVLAGADRAFVSVLAGGCDGIVSGMSNVFSRRFRIIYDHYSAGDSRTASNMNRELLRDTGCLLEGPFLPRLKVALEYIGHTGGKVRSPLPQITEESKKLLLTQLAGMDF